MSLLVHFPLNKKNFQEAKMSQTMFDADPTHYYLKNGLEYIQCASGDVYNAENVYYEEVFLKKGSISGKAYANNLIYNTSGKLGGCYTFNGTNSYIYTDLLQGCSFTDMSLSFWFKTNSVSIANQYIISVNRGGGYSDQLIGAAIENNQLVICGATTSSLKYTISANTWYHCVITVTANPAKVIYYINGTKQGEAVCSTTRQQYYCYTVGARANSNLGASSSYSYPFTGALNDVRLFNHKLGAKEAKVLSQGLVLHYSLRGKYLKNITNLLSLNVSACIGGWLNWCSSGGTTPTTQYLSGDGVYTNKYLKETCYQNTTSNCSPYIGYTAAANKTYTFSAWVKAVSGHAGKTLKILNWTNDGTTVNSNQPYHILSDEWELVESSLECSAQSAAMCGIRVVNEDLTSGNAQFLMCNAQLEIGEATPWKPGGTIQEAQACIDESGLDNHGNMTDNLVVAQGAKRHRNCVQFPSGTAYINCGSAAMVKDAITVSMWINFSTWGNPISCTEGGGWNFENSSGIQFPVYIASVGYKIANSGITTSTLANSWHMITGTCDRTNVKIYIDGVLKATTATGSSNLIGYANNSIFIGAEAAASKDTPASTTFVGNISDVRIYGTALSADDILNLYQVSQSATHENNLYAYDFVENESDTDFTESGSIEASMFEDDAVKIYLFNEEDEKGVGSTQLYEI